jgi:hypothetical protein
VQIGGPSCCSPTTQVVAADSATHPAAKNLVAMIRVATFVARGEDRQCFGRSSTQPVARTLDRCTLFSSFLI